MPLLGGDLLADVAGVLAGGDDAGEDGGLVASVEDELLGEGVGVAGPDRGFWVAEGVQHALPTAVGAGGGFVEHEVEVDVEQARGVFGALDVAAHPVETVGDAASIWTSSACVID